MFGGMEALDRLIVGINAAVFGRQERRARPEGVRAGTEVAPCP